MQIDLSSPDAGAAWQTTPIDLDALSDSELVPPPNASIRSAGGDVNDAGRSPSR